MKINAALSYLNALVMCRNRDEADLYLISEQNPSQEEQSYASPASIKED